MEPQCRKTILLTGGSGFIGRNIRESLLADRYHIIAPSSKEFNCADQMSVDAFFASQRVDVVIHAAVKPGHRNAKEQTDLFYTNTRMFFNLERHSDKFEKMLVIGSGAIYDNRYYRPQMVEDEWLKHMPADEHGYCKYVCEKVIEHSRNIYDLRVFGVFGRYEDYAIRFISNAICKALCGMPITLRQDRCFDYLYVNDMMPILDWFITHTPRHHAYNITPDQSVSLYDLAQMVRSISGCDVPINVAAEGVGMEYTGDNGRLRSEITDLRFTPIEESVAELMRWYGESLAGIDKTRLLIDK